VIELARRDGKQSGRPIDQWDDPADCDRHGHQADRGEGMVSIDV
jgi:hypothetical protein